MSFILWPTGSLRTSLVFVGGSVCWGLYLTFEDQYISKLQRAIDLHLGTYLNGWPVRHIHSDDWQDGSSQNSGAFNASSLNHWGVGPAGHKFKAIAGLPAPAQTPTGTFHPTGAWWGGPGYGPYRNPGVNINWAALRIHVPAISSHWTNPPTWLFLGLSGQGSVQVWNSSGGLEGTIAVNSPSDITQYPITLGSAGTHIDINADTDIYVHYVCPMRVQHQRHILCQVVARDSYCLQDFTGKVWEITHSILNKSAPWSTAPIYVIFDSYNSMVIAGGSGHPDRRLTPSEYASTLDTFGSSLISNSPPGLQGFSKIILTNPVSPKGITAHTPKNGGGGLAWLTGESISTYGVALSALASTKGWAYFDQNDPLWGANLTSSDWESDGIHPNQVGSDKIATKLCNFFGIPASWT